MAEEETQEKGSHEATTSSVFSSEQLDQLYKLLSISQTGQSLPNVPIASLAHKGNFLSTLNTMSQFKTPWIIDSGPSDHMIDSYSLFSSYSPCVGNLKVKITNESLSSVAGKGTIKISDSLTLESALHVPKLSYNFLSISQLTKKFNYSTKFFPTHCVFEDLS